MLNRDSKNGTKKYYYNWSELRRDSDDNFNAILCLTYCLIVGYNKPLALQSKNLFNRLKITHIPQKLFKRKFLYFNEGKIISRYKCRDIQSYFVNPGFIYYNVPVKQKVEYLYLLSHRRISENQNYIPEYYVNAKNKNNIFVKSENNKLYFIPEIIKQRGKN